ncbi:DNA methyltransferase, partial [Brucella lupini]|uniref:DNA methyltransferase n=1 Tax=Brucella lupini TaxID=255457 RepID=UPI001F46E1B4
RNAHGRAIHPTEKPTSLLEILIRTSCPEGGLVGDWFAGSGAASQPGTSHDRAQGHTGRDARQCSAHRAAGMDRAWATAHLER